VRSPAELRYPRKPEPGDRVAVVSPSLGAPGRYPDVYELGLRRLRCSPHCRATASR
jgi:hypothetical protein